MEAQLTPLDQSAVGNLQSAICNEQLTARQWSTLLGITPKALHLRKVEAAAQRLVRGGLTKFFAFGALPEDYRIQLEEKRRTFQCLRFADLLEVQTTATWQPEKHITELPAATQEKAYKVKDVMDVYFAAIANQITSRDAETKARAMWLQLTGKTISDRQIRRWVKAVEDRGGPELARIEAYADGKSVPHHNALAVSKLTRTPRACPTITLAFLIRSKFPMNLSARLNRNAWSQASA